MEYINKLIVRTLMMSIMMSILLLVACARQATETPVVPTSMPAVPEGGEQPASEVIIEETAESEETPTNEPVMVEIRNFAFAQREITVNVGDTVTWTNQDNVRHTATADDGSFDTGLLAKGESGSVTFDTPGIYTYHCSPHPNMQGTVEVRE